MFYTCVCQAFSIGDTRGKSDHEEDVNECTWKKTTRTKSYAKNIQNENGVKKKTFETDSNTHTHLNTSILTSGTPHNFLLLPKFNINQMKISVRMRFFSYGLPHFSLSFHSFGSLLHCSCNFVTCNGSFHIPLGDS